MILVLILSVLLALATPFGNFIAGAFKATTAGFFSVNENALGVAGITIPGQEFEDVDNDATPKEPVPCNIEGHYIGDGRGEHMIPATDCPNSHTYTCECDSWTVPDGGTYYVGVTVNYGGNQLGNYTGAKAVYTAGQQLPCGYTPKEGDVYTDGDYEYRYNLYYNSSRWDGRNNAAYINNWGARVLDATKESYGDMLDEINGKIVGSIQSTFSNCTNLKVAPKLSNNATFMQYTFANCTNLTSVPAIPASATNMQGTFQNCKSLSVTPVVPIGVTDMGGSFGGGTFCGCTSLTTAPIIPSSVTDIEGIFQYCTSLKTYIGSAKPDGDFSGYIIPNNVTSMAAVFSGCTSISKPPVIPQNITSLSSTFSGCTGLTDLGDFVIPNSVTNMSSTFSNCTSLTTAPDISHCTQLTNMSRTFDGCSSLTTVSALPNSVTNMSNTFSNCTSLTTAPILPSSVTDMSYTFWICKSLTTYAGAPNGTADGDFSGYVIPNSVTNLEQCFRNCSLMKTAPSIPSSVTNTDKTFYACNALTGNIAIPCTAQGGIGYSKVTTYHYDGCGH